MRDINRTNPQETARLNSLRQQAEAIQAQVDAFDRLKLSQRELIRVKRAEQKASDRAVAPVASTAAPSRMLEEEFRVARNKIAEIQSALGRVRVNIDTEEAAESIRNVEEAVENVENALRSLEEVNGTDAQIEAKKLYTQQLKLAEQALKRLRTKEADISGLVRLEGQAQQLGNELNKISINWSAFKADPELNATWENLRSEAVLLAEAIKQAQDAGDPSQTAALRKEYTNLSQQIRILKSEIQGAGQAKLSFGDAIMATGRKFSSYLVSLFGFGRIISMFRDALRYIQEIDRAMTALRRVTNETAVTYNDFLSEAYKRAQRLGTSVSGIINATADFARLGYNLSDATALGDAAAILHNVANVGTERLPMEDGVQGLISAMKANTNAFCV
jgi:hypothetical protein